MPTRSSFDTMANRTTLAELTELVSPPKRPLRCSNESNWKTLKQAIDFPIPDAFLDYGRTYGTGEIAAAGYTLQIGNPLDPKYAKWALAQSEIMRTRGDGPELRATRFYPEPDGVLPFATDLCGDLVFFTRDRAIASCPTDPNGLIPYNYDLIGFLHSLFSGTLSPEYFPNSETSQANPVFSKKSWI